MKRQGWSIAVALGFLLGGTTSQAQSVPADQAPAEWLLYAEGATEKVTAWLNTSEPPAPAIRTAVLASRPDAAQPAPPLLLKLWVDRRGRIERVEHAPITPEADAQLQTMLVARELSRPPRNMVQPMRLAVTVKPAEPEEAMPTGAI